MDFYPFRFDVKRLRPLLQRDLYTNPNVAIRELTQNAHDAIMRRAKMEETFNPEKDGEIIFRIDTLSGTLSVLDNGVGMSRDTLLNVFRYYGRTDKEANEEVGTFGLGAKSIFARSGSFTIHTKSLETGETLQVYATLDGLTFQPSPPLREASGTTITVPSQVKANNLQEYYCEALDDYCRSVKTPIYVEENGKNNRRLVSQKTPWHVKSTLIPGDGFEVYVAVTDYDENTGSYVGESTRNLFCVDGFFVSQAKSDCSLFGIAVNLTQKNLANLTMSRDSFIDDEKFKALPELVINTIATHIAKMNLNSLQAIESQAKFIEWIGEHGEVWPVWAKLPNETRTTIKALTDKICVCPAPEESWRQKDNYKTTLLKTLLKPKPKYFLFGKPRQVVEDLATNKNAVIIYHECGQDRQTLKACLTKYGVRAFTGTQSGCYAVCTPCETSYYDTLKEVENAHSRASTKLKDQHFIFPQQVLQRKVQQTTHRLSIYAIKLKENETLDTWIDLRKASGKDVIFKGTSMTLNQVDVNACDAVVAPPEFFKLAQAAKNKAVIFTQDMTSLCLLVTRGANTTDTNAMHTILTTALPKKICEKLNWWKFRTPGDYRALASLATSLDWKNPYSTWLFTLAANGESAYAVATDLDPNLDPETIP